MRIEKEFEKREKRYKLLSDDRYAVLRKLTTVQGGHIAERLLDVVRESREMTRTVLIGPPGVGKTTIFGQIIDYPSGNVSIDGVTFDEVSAYYEKRSGKMKEWDPETWSELNTTLFQRSLAPPHPKGRCAKKYHKVIELPGFGERAEDAIAKGKPVWDPGVTALKKIADESAENHDNTEFVFFTPDFRGQNRAVAVRRAVASMSKEEAIQQFLENRFNIHITGRPGSDFEKLSGTEKGKLIKLLVGWSAQPELIDKRIKAMLDEGYKTFSGIPKSKFLSIEVHPTVRVLDLQHEEIVKTSKIFQELYLKKIRELSIPKGRYWIVMNQFDSEIPVYWMIDDRTANLLETLRP